MALNTKAQQEVDAIDKLEAEIRVRIDALDIATRNSQTLRGRARAELALARIRRLAKRTEAR
jgi:hypothetical protein